MIKLYQEQPFRILGTLFLCVIMMYGLFKRDIAILIGGIGWLVIVLRQDNSNERYLQKMFPVTDDIFSQLQLTNSTLYIKQQPLLVSEIRKVVLDQMDENHAYLDFPYNHYGKLGIRFPLSQLETARQWFKTHLPATELIR